MADHEYAMEINEDFSVSLALWRLWHVPINNQSRPWYGHMETSITQRTVSVRAVI